MAYKKLGIMSMARLDIPRPHSATFLVAIPILAGSVIARQCSKVGRRESSCATAGYRDERRLPADKSTPG